MKVKVSKSNICKPVRVFSLIDVVNDVSTFKEFKTNTILRMPQRKWTPKQLQAMRVFVGLDKKQKLRHEGTC